MRRIGLVLVLVLVALPAGATDFTPDGTCTQDDGTQGLANGTTRDDGGCVTPAEYEANHSIEGLIDAGVIRAVQPVDDRARVEIVSPQYGTTSWHYLLIDPWMRPVSANSELEPDAPTVREAWDFWIPRI